MIHQGCKRSKTYSTRYGAERKQYIEELSRLRKGDEDALRSVYLRYHGRVLAFAFSMLKVRDTSEDVVQETFIRLWLHRERIDPESDLQMYIFTIANTIAKRIVVDLFRVRVKEARMRDVLLQKTDVLRSPVEESVHGKELDVAIRRALCELPGQQRRVFTLSRELGLSYREIAEKLVISTETVKRHLVAAKKSLVRGMEQRGL